MQSLYSEKFPLPCYYRFEIRWCPYFVEIVMVERFHGMIHGTAMQGILQLSSMAVCLYKGRMIPIPSPESNLEY